MRQPRTAWTLFAMATLVGLLSVPSALAGPWTKEAGQVYVKLAQGVFSSASGTDATGMRMTPASMNMAPADIDDISYLGTTSSVYFEVGVLDARSGALQVVGYLPYILAGNTFGPGLTPCPNCQFIQSSLGDATVGLQYTPPLDPGIPYAARVEVKLPLYELGVEGPLGHEFPAPGDGQLDVTAWLGAGGSVSGTPLYFFAEVGYRHRTETFLGTVPDDDRTYGDGFVFSSQIGYTFFDRLLLAANVGGILSFDNDVGVNKSSVSAGPSMYLILWDGWALEASFDPVIYNNDDGSPGTGLGLGVSYKN
jgi:hypothetical protein